MFDESLPRVEYHLRHAGEKLIPILQDIQDLGEAFSQGANPQVPFTKAESN